MEFRTRHMALIAYTGIAVLVIAKDLVSAPTDLIALLGPIAGMFAWDKIEQNLKAKKGN